MSVLTNLAIASLGISAIGGAAYKITKTDVNVVNTPNVNVVNTPNVNVPNGIAVTNSPTVVVQDDREPVNFELSLDSTALGASTSTGFYAVPAGKTLHITHFSGIGAAPTGVYVQSVALTVGEGEFSQQLRDFASLSYMPGENSSNYTICTFSENVDTVAQSGQMVGLYMGRSSAFVGSPSATVTVRVSGYLKLNP